MLKYLKNEPKSLSSSSVTSGDSKLSTFLQYVTRSQVNKGTTFTSAALLTTFLRKSLCHKHCSLVCLMLKTKNQYNPLSIREVKSKTVFLCPLGSSSE